MIIFYNQKTKIKKIYKKIVDYENKDIDFYKHTFFQSLR